MEKEARSYFFDNAKFLLIILVVIGHIIEPLRETSLFFKSLYITIYLFHMPCFVLLSGYFARQRKKNFELVKFLKLYIFFQIIFVFVSKTYVSLLHPLWLLWYLFSWIAWNLSIPLLSDKKKIYIVIVAFLVGLAIGYLSEVSYYLSLSRMIVFYPFFLLGYYSDRWWLWKKKKKYQTIILRIASVLMLSAFFVTIYLTFGNIDPYKVLYFSFPYSESPTPFGFAWAFRLFAYLSSCITGLAFFLLVPQRKTFFTDYGKKTLQVYLLHACLLYPLYKFDIFDRISNNWDKIWLLTYSVLMTIFLSSKYVSYIYDLIEWTIDLKNQALKFIKKHFQFKI